MPSGRFPGVSARGETLSGETKTPRAAMPARNEMPLARLQPREGLRARVLRLLLFVQEPNARSDRGIGALSAVKGEATGKFR